MLVLTAGENGPASRSRMDEQKRACTVLGVDLLWGAFTDCSLAADESAVVHVIERVLAERHIDLMYTHSEDDSHQDHRTAALLSLGAGRNLQRILQYNSPSSRHFSPHLLIDITDTIDKKLNALAEHDSQVTGSERVDLQAVRAQAVMFGALVQVGAAEGFISERFLLDV